MDIKLTNTFLFVKNIEASKKFYIENLQQEIQQELKDFVVFTSGLALWQLPEDSLIAEKLQNHLNREGNNRVELYFETDDVDQYFEFMQKRGITFLHELHKESWGQRDFRFFDPDNNLVEIGEKMSTLKTD
jgi:Lactoylglutathione lyase and related lyases